MLYDKMPYLEWICTNATELASYPSVTRGRSRTSNRTLLHDVMYLHRESFHCDYDNDSADSGETGNMVICCGDKAGNTVNYHSNEAGNTVDYHSDEAANTFDYCGSLLIQMLLRSGVDVNAKDSDGKTPFLDAASNHCERSMKILLDTGKIDIDYADNDGYTALTHLLDNIDDEKELRKLSDYSYWEIPRLENCLRLLMGHGCDINAKGNFENIDDEKELRTTSDDSSWEIPRLENCLRLLMEHGFDINAKGIFGNTPLQWLLESTYQTYLSKFIEICQPDLFTNNYIGLLHSYTKLTSDVHFAYDNVVFQCILARLSLKLDEQDINGRIALMHAAHQRNHIYCQILIEAGARVNIKDNNGLSVLHYASLCKDSERADENFILSLSKYHQVMINSRDCFGDTPLVYAAAVGNLPMFNILYPIYDISDEIQSNRLVSVADINDQRLCLETIKLLQEDWVVVELDKDVIDESSKTCIELGIEEVDDWLDQQTKKNHINQRGTNR